MNKKINLTRKILLCFFIVALFFTAFMLKSSVQKAEASQNFSVKFNYSKDFLPKGNVGEEYDLSDILTIDSVVDYDIKCIINFKDESEFEIENKKFIPTEYGVYSVSIIPDEGDFAAEKFNVLIEDKNENKTFDYSGKIDVSNGSFTYGTGTFLHQVAYPTDYDEYKSNGLLLNFVGAGEFKFKEAVDFSTADTVIDVALAGGKTYASHDKNVFEITLTDAEDEANTVTIQPYFTPDAYYVKAGHSGMGGVLIGRLDKSTIYGTASYPTVKYVAQYGAYVSCSSNSLLKGYGISEAGIPYVRHIEYNAESGALSYSTDTNIIDFKNASDVGENIWKGFSGSKVYVSVKVEKAMSLLVTKLGGYDLTDEKSEAFASIVEDRDPTIKLTTSTDFYKVGQRIDLLKGIVTDGVYGNYVYSPCVNISLSLLENSVQKPVITNGGNFVPQKSGIYVCAYQAEDFGGDKSETLKAVFVVVDGDAFCTLKNVNYEDCDEGSIVKIQQGILTVGGKDYVADTVVYYPDGSAHNVSEIQTTRGLYRIKYSVLVNGIEYSKETSFIARIANYNIGDGCADFSYGESYYPEYVSKQGLKINVAKGEKFVYNKVVNIKNLTKSDSLIELYAMPNTIGVPDADTMYIRFTDVYDSNNYFTIHINEYDGARDSTYYRVAVGTGTSAGRLGDIDFFNKFGGLTSSFSLCGYGPYGSVDEMVHVDNALKITFDYASKSFYIGGDRFFSKLDDPVLYSTAWKGFTTGECVMSISYDDYNGDAIARSFLTVVAGEEIESGDYHYDRTKPVINVDFGEYEKDALPFGVKNIAYPVFNAVGLDGYTNNVKIAVKAYYDYDGVCYSVSIKDGKFIPTRAGKYTLVYVATDEFGNTSEELVGIDVLNAYSDTEIVIDENMRLTEILAGQKINIPKFRVKNSNGKAKSNVYIKTNGKIIEQNVTSFCPRSAGVYTVVYEAVDFLGEKTILSYDIEVKNSNDVVIRENPSLPRFFIDGYKYFIDDLTGYVYDGGEKTVKANIYIIDKDGKRAVSDLCIMPLVANDGDFASVIYEFSYNGQAKEYIFDIPTYKVYNVVDSEEKIDMSAYFIGDVASRSAGEDSVSFKVAKDGAKVVFISDIVIFDGRIEFSLPENLANFGSLELLLIDSEKGLESVSLSFNVTGKRLSGVIYNGKEYRLNTSEKYTVSFDKDGKTVFVGGASINLDVDINGMPFNGFVNGRAYLQFVFNGVSGESGLAVSRINNQLLGNLSYDIVKPMINMYENFGGSYLSGERYTIKLPVYGDVLDPSVKLWLTVTDPSNNPLKSVDGVLLENIICKKEYVIELKDIGAYTVSFKVASVTEKGGVYFWDEEFVYSISVKDIDPPLINVDVSEEVRVKTGSTVKIPGATANDNYDKDVKVYVYVETPRGVYVNIDENSFVAQLKGKYKVIYMAYDKAGNVAFRSYTVIAE